MYAIMFELSNEEVSTSIIKDLKNKGFKKCALSHSHIYRHQSESMLPVFEAVDYLVKEFSDELTELFVCKMDDVSNFKSEIGGIKE